MTAELLGLAKAMDSLWFFPKNPAPEMNKTPLPTSESPDSRNSSQSQISFNTTSEGDKRYITRGKPRCHSSSPSKSSARRWKRSRSSRSCGDGREAGDAELEEVKGFMDLGFDFKRVENPSDQLVRLIPGLRMIGDCGCSPLMDLRGERDWVVKSHLKRWARTVALVAQQE